MRMLALTIVTVALLGACSNDAGPSPDAIAAWTPSDNTMPRLASHPMRTVGWAYLALATESLDEAHEYAGHAALHVAIARDALTC